MLLEKYIRKYLFLYDIVTIKGFGKFSLVTDNESHKVDSNSYFPVCKKVIFDKFERDFIDNDFYYFVSIYENISTDQAYNLINEDVNYLKLKLNNGELITIKDIGSFKYFNDEFTFFPITTLENNPFTFGMKPLKL